MIFKEMEYQWPDVPFCKMLASGDVGPHSYVVLSYGTHPCCYVSLPRGVAIKTDDICCHGGITYHEARLPNDKIDPEKQWIGWDYAHYGDYIATPGKIDFGYGKKWTTMELVNHCFKVIEQLARYSTPLMEVKQKNA